MDRSDVIADLLTDLLVEMRAIHELLQKQSPTALEEAKKVTTWVEWHRDYSSAVPPNFVPKITPPLYPIPEPFMPMVPNTHPLTTCQKCGMTFGGVTSYACMHAGCPTGLGPTIC
jgi:hypothetical protein